MLLDKPASLKKQTFPQFLLAFEHRVGTRGFSSGQAAVLADLLLVKKKPICDAHPSPLFSEQCIKSSKTHVKHCKGKIKFKLKIKYDPLTDQVAATLVPPPMLNLCG